MENNLLGDGHKWPNKSCEVKRVQIYSVYTGTVLTEPIINITVYCLRSKHNIQNKAVFFPHISSSKLLK
jgi:hypothetical protein